MRLLGGEQRVRRREEYRISAVRWIFLGIGGWMYFVDSLLPSAESSASRACGWVRVRQGAGDNK